MLVLNCPGIHAQQAPLLSLGSILGHDSALPASQIGVPTSYSRQYEQKRRRRGLLVLGSSSNGSGPSTSSNGASASSKGASTGSGKSLDERILSGEVSNATGGCVVVRLVGVYVIIFVHC